VRRAERVTIDAYNLAGEPVHIDADDLLARVVQHETDHLDGRLFIDRLSETAQLEVRGIVQEFEIQFQSQRERGEMPSDEAIENRWEELEKLRT
jgi:peptide deformylase